MDEEEYNKINRKMMEEFLQKKEEESYERDEQIASGYVNPEDTNLIKWQLDLSEDLERIRHLLRGDERDRNKPHVWVPTENPNLKPFNDYGVRLIMNIMNFYLNRNTILSNYDDKTINWKVYDFGNTINDLIFNKFEEMMNTLDEVSLVENLTGRKATKLPNGKLIFKIEYIGEKVVFHEIDESITEYINEIIKDHLLEKVKLFPTIIMELVDSIHSAYLRAYHGGERESLRTARHVTQTETPRMNYPMPQVPVQKQSKWYNPVSWGR